MPKDIGLISVENSPLNSVEKKQFYKSQTFNFQNSSLRASPAPNRNEVLATLVEIPDDSSMVQSPKFGDFEKFANERKQKINFFEKRKSFINRIDEMQEKMSNVKRSLSSIKSASRKMASHDKLFKKSFNIVNNQAKSYQSRLTIRLTEYDKLDAEINMD